MNELIVLTPRAIGDETVQTVNARDLHAYLESKQDFSTWIKSRIEQYDFEKGVDYLLHKVREQLPSGTKTLIEYFVSISMAKEISMVERNQKGKEARQYFIECEKRVLAQIAKLTPAQALLAQVQLMVDQERRVAEVEDKVRRIEAKQQAFDEGSKFFTVLGYCVWKGIPALTLKEAAQIGRRATKVSKEKKVLVDRVRDPRFGLVNSYHENVLNEVFASMLDGED